MVRAQKHQGHLERLVLFHHDFASMIGRIVYHDYCGLPPPRIDGIIVVAQLDQEEAESVTIIFTTIDGIHQLTITSGCCNDAESSQPLHGSDHISLAWPAPTMLPLICLVEHTFVNVDNGLPLHHILNVVGSCQLALQLSLFFVVGIIDGVDFLVGEA